MNDIDELIKKELGTDVSELRELIESRPGMIGMAMDAMKGNMGRWVVLVAIANFVTAGFMFWIGYHFFTADILDTRIFWGVWLVIAMIAGSAMKNWSWMEMNRVSTQKEITRLEVALLALKNSWSR